MEYFRKKILALVYENKGNFFEITKALKEKQQVEITSENQSENAILICDDDYPKSLKAVRLPPYGLFYKGNTDLLHTNYKHIAFVDDFTQADTDEGKYNRELILSNLKSEFVCVLQERNGKVNKTLEQMKNLSQNAIILVVAKGIDLNNENIKYVLEHNGLVISTCPTTQTEETELTIEFANSLQSALADIVYVNEIKNEGESVIAFALAQNKDIATSPYSNFKSLRINNDLIRDGAFVITNELDFENLLLI